MPRDAYLGLHFFDELARRRAADRPAAHDPIAFRIIRRRMTDHQEGPHLADRFIAGAKSRVDFVFAEFDRGAERCDIRAAASEDSDPANRETLAVERDPLLFEKRYHLAPIELARHREHRGARPAHVGDDLARVLDAAEVGQIT